MIDYALLPPETNSGRLYSGPGSAPMMAAASAWRGLAGEITSTLTSYETTISQLTDDEWTGPAATAMATAAKPYLAWMTDTAAKAEQAATKAVAAAAAFETAHANTPPPTVIAANRTQHARLVASNVVGQNAAAIMASEAQYQQMWAQAAGVMYSYAASSATATQLSTFTEPAQTTNPAGQGNQAAATQQAATTAAGGAGQIAQAMPTMQSSIQSLSAPAAAQSGDAGALAGLFQNFLANASVNGIASLITDPLNGVVSFGGTTLAYTPSSLIPLMTAFFGGGGFNAFGGGSAGAGLGALLAPGGPLSALGDLGGTAAAGAASSAAAGTAFAMGATTPVVSAGVGQATLVGSSLSAPAAWAAAAPAATTEAVSEALQASSWEAAPEIESIAAMPGGMPAGGDRGGFGLSTPRYGFKPTVMPRPVIAG